jgi:hypothetical protein
LTDVVYFVIGKVSGDRLFSALFIGLAHPLLQAVILILKMTICSRCYGTNPTQTVSCWLGDADHTACIKMASRFLDDASD